MRHFISAVYRVSKLDCILDEIYLNKRVVHVDTFPMGINYDMYSNTILNFDIKKEELFYNRLMYRYKNDDGFGLPSSSFTICTFWLVRALYVIGEKRKH